VDKNKWMYWKLEVFGDFHVINNLVLKEENEKVR